MHYKGSYLATFSPIHKPELLCHPKLTFKMSLRNGFGLPTAKCHQSLAYDPHQALNPASQLSHGHTKSKVTSGGVSSSLCTRVTHLGCASTCHLCWEHLCGDLPGLVTSSHLSSAPACLGNFMVPLKAAPGEVFLPARETHPPQVSYREHCPCF